MTKTTTPRIHRLGLVAAALCFAASAPAAADGFYIAPMAGVAVIDQTVTVGGVKLVDQGVDAAIFGARLGWGMRTAAGLYLGAEAEGFGASGRSRAVVNGHAYSWTLNGGAGAFGRIGWAPASGSALFFARAGALALFSGGSTQVVPAIGAGAEVIISGPWFARIDLGYAWNDRELYIGTIGVGFRF